MMINQSEAKLCILVPFFEVSSQFHSTLFETSSRLWLPRAGGRNACQFISNNVHLLCCLVIEDNVENNFLQAVKWDHLTCRRVVLSGSPAWHNWSVKVRLSSRMCCCLFYSAVFSCCDFCNKAIGPTWIGKKCQSFLLFFLCLMYVCVGLEVQLVMLPV